MRCLSRFFSISIFLVLFSFVSCGGGGSDNPPGSQEPNPGDNSPAPTSADLINQALEDGALDQETALIYKTFAAFNDPRLPAEFAADDPGIEDLGFLWEAKYDYEYYSAQIQDTLAPFLVPPMYEGSWWDLQNNYSAEMSIMSLPCNPARESCPLLTSWNYHEGQKVIVWYQERYQSEDYQKALALLTEVETKIWPMLTAYMGAEPRPDNGGTIPFEGPNQKLDIALVDMGPLGTTFASFAVKGCGESSTYILINRSAGQQDLGPIMAHEFMHAIQFALPVKDCLVLHYKTLMESTANWAVNYIYRKQNQWEHQHIFAYTDDITRSLLDESPQIRPYGAHLFPLYLTEAVSEDAVKQAWNLAASHSQPQVIENVADLEVVWPEFAARLWNQPPLDEFQQWDDITRQVRNGLETINLDLAGKAYDDWVVGPYEGLPGLSAHLFHVVFHDTMIRTAGFFNGFTYRLEYDQIDEFGQIVKAVALTAEQRQGAHLHAMLKIDGSWLPMLIDWTDIPYVLFPQDVPQGRVDEVLLVYSNSSSDSNHIARYRGLPSHFWLTNMPWTAPWEGVVKFRAAADGLTETFQANHIKFDALYPVTMGFIEIDDPEGAPWATLYGLTQGSASWTISGTDSSGCAYSGGGTKSLSSGFMPNQFILCHFIRSGACLHGFVLNGFDQHPPIEWPVSVVCPDSSTSYEYGHGQFWFRLISPGYSSAELSTDGMSINGTGVDAVDDAVTGSWQMYAVP